MEADEVAFKFFLNNRVEFSNNDEAKSNFDGQHGAMSYNKTIQKDGKRHYTCDIKDWIISVEQHEGVVSSSDWIAVQRLSIVNIKNS